MNSFSRKTISSAVAAVILSTSIMTSLSVSTAEAGMRNQQIQRVHRGHHGNHAGRNLAIGLGVLGAIAVINAIQASKNAVPAHVKRRCAQYGEWRELVANAKRNARIQYGRGDQRGGDEWLRSARFYASKADQARRDCERWRADYR